MYMKRKGYEELLAWKTRDQGTTAMLIEGARRVGKSFLAKDFASKEYKSYLYIDFSRPHPRLLEIFKEFSYDLDEFFSRLSLLFRTPLYRRQSCIIFDEVQLFPLARQLIKHLVADGRYDYIETGSLISIKSNIAEIVLPSEEIRMALNPLDFEEFLDVIDESGMIKETIHSHYESLTPLGDGVHREVMKLFRTYMLVGGMPQAVSHYAETKDFLGVRRIQQNILALYREDISRYAGESEMKVRLIFDDIPSQLSSHQKRFKLASLKKDARMRTYEDAFMWLSDSKIVNCAYNSTDPTIGLKFNIGRSTLKCYMADTGLLTVTATQSGPSLEEEVINGILYGKLSLNEGMFFENVVAQQLRAKGHQLYFYTEAKDDASRKNIEIDFLIRQMKKICPIEVKSGDYRKHASLDYFVNKYRDRLGKRYIICTKDLKVDGDLVLLPVYMTGCL